MGSLAGSLAGVLQEFGRSLVGVWWEFGGSFAGLYDL